MNIPLVKSDIEDCHRLGESNPKIQLLDLSTEKNCYSGLNKKLDLQHITRIKLGFPETNLFLMKI